MVQTKTGRPMRLCGTQTLDKRLPWEPSLPSVAVMVETDSLRQPRGLVLAVLVVAAVCTLSLALLALRAKEIPAVELTPIISSHPVVVVRWWRWWRGLIRSWWKRWRGLSGRH